MLAVTELMDSSTMKILTCATNTTTVFTDIHTSMTVLRHWSLTKLRVLASERNKLHLLPENVKRRWPRPTLRASNVPKEKPLDPMVFLLLTPPSPTPPPAENTLSVNSQPPPRSLAVLMVLSLTTLTTNVSIPRMVQKIVHAGTRVQKTPSVPTVATPTAHVQLNHWKSNCGNVWIS